MSDTQGSSNIVIGLGLTGLSCARYLAKQGIDFALVDTRLQPPNLDEIRAEFPDCAVHLGELSADVLSQADTLYLSPGVRKDHPAIVQAVAQGAKLSGDIDLFCQALSTPTSTPASIPIVAITGSNAKSTVTSLVGDMAKAAGLEVGVGGNLGTPVLDMLDEVEKDLYVLELSSFQLETTHDLNAQVATILNISPDHMDRYDDDLSAYQQAKQRIFLGCRSAVENRDDTLTRPQVANDIPVTSFGLNSAAKDQFGLLTLNGTEYLAFSDQPILPASQLRMPGRHNLANALAALALGHAVDLPIAAMKQALQSFAGLEHRCQWVAEIAGVQYYNDSKGTNVGATVAALEGLGADLASSSQTERKIVLIAGGEGKGAEFTDLIDPVTRYVRDVVLLGADADKIAKTLSSAGQGDAVQCHHVSNLADAVAQVSCLAKAGDAVLLSPACASFDMYKSYVARGEHFVDIVQSRADQASSQESSHVD